MPFSSLPLALLDDASRHSSQRTMLLSRCSPDKHGHAMSSAHATTLARLRGCLGLFLLIVSPFHDMLPLFYLMRLLFFHLQRHDVS